MIRIVFELVIAGAAVYFFLLWRKSKGRVFNGEFAGLKRLGDGLSRDMSRIQERMKEILKAEQHLTDLLRATGAFEIKPKEQPRDYEKTA